MRSRKGQLVTGLAVVITAGVIIVGSVTKAIIEKASGIEVAQVKSPCATANDCNVMRNR